MDQRHQPGRMNPAGRRCWGTESPGMSSPCGIPARLPPCRLQQWLWAPRINTCCLLRGCSSAACPWAVAVAVALGWVCTLGAFLAPSGRSGPVAG